MSLSLGKTIAAAWPPPCWQVQIVQVEHASSSSCDFAVQADAGPGTTG